MDAASSLRQALLDKLRSRAWPAGHRLPAERALGVQHGLSRSSVRRVLQELKAQGLIVQTVGSGTYVDVGVDAALARLAARQPEGPAPALSPADLMGARVALEPALTELVVANATAADFARMDACNDAAEAAPTLEAFEHWDAQLHEAIAEATHNGVVAQVFRLLGAARAQAEWGALKRRSASPERRREYERQHREWVAALKDRDAERARAACLAHLQRVRQNLLGC